MVGCLQGLATGYAFAQSAEGMPVPSNFERADYPQTLSGTRVAFQICSPSAGQVQINLLPFV